MSENTIWYGYLEAGNKSTPVVVDQRLNTGRSDTVYIFNMARETFLEYKREIVDAKLRELQDGEADLAALKASFNHARKEFRPRVNRTQNLSERAATEVTSAREEESEEGLDELAPSTEDTDVEAVEDEDDDWDESE